MAEIVGVHGIRGAVKLKVFSEDPRSLARYSPLLDERGNGAFALRSLVPHGGIWLAELDGVKDRTAAEKMRGLRLYAARGSLPKLKEKNTYYHADLVGLSAQYPDGREMGKVIAVANFGASDLLEIQPPKGASFYVPFTNAVVPDVSLEAKTVTINPPPGLID
jgi:16S rRNA processing protein RimM